MPRLTEAERTRHAERLKFRLRHLEALNSDIDLLNSEITKILKTIKPLIVELHKKELQRNFELEHLNDLPVRAKES